MRFRQHAGFWGLVVVALLLTGCASPPDAELTEAQAALDEARTSAQAKPSTWSLTGTRVTSVWTARMSSLDTTPAGSLAAPLEKRLAISHSSAPVG